MIVSERIVSRNIVFRSIAAALAVGLALCVAELPASAKSRAPHPGHAANAQAIEPGQALMTPERERALRECSELGNKFTQRDWGVTQNTQMSTCMTAHGQME